MNEKNKVMYKKSTNLLGFTHKDVNIHQQKTCYQGFFKMDEYHLSHQ